MPAGSTLPLQTQSLPQAKAVWAFAGILAVVFAPAIFAVTLRLM